MPKKERMERLLEKANSLPSCPGVYVMKNAQGRVIYVGKSRKLKSRVSQYFQNSEKNLKTARMVSLVEDFEYFVCRTEMEALSLENNLIKRHTPKYNIRLKDAKSYPYIKVTQEEYPRILFTRSRLNDKAKYYGPYTGTSTVFSVLTLLHKDFGIPSCKKKFPRDIGKERPCIYYQMKQCCGLCTGDVSKEEYAEMIRSATEILKGNTAKTRRGLEEKMLAYSEREQYEAAIRCRNTIRALENLSEKQKVVSSPDDNRDIFGLFVGDLAASISVLNVRDGVMMNKSDFVFGRDKLLDDSTLGSFICEYYRGKGDIPLEIYLSFSLDEEERGLIEAYLLAYASVKVEIRTPERGDKKALCEIAVNNAEQAALQYVKDSERSDGTLAKLAGLLGLDALPDRIEVYDISNLGTEHKTAGMIVCEEGKLKRSDYRSFTIKDIEGTDDYACMQETLSRRFAHLSDGEGSFALLPDLILLDGGRGHVSTVKEVLGEMGIDVPVFGMVKDDFHKTRALCNENEEIHIARNQEVFVFLYKLQEEVHRYTVSKMTSAKLKSLKTSSLEKIKGIGEKKAKKLLLAFSSMEELRGAELSELQAIKGISEADARAVYDFFHKGDET
ncbi:MAG: excinuclease ABC subunit UvrC [Ruminococcaceae bacterium]|nr:excinuclease ABC subunit UvrC [Oscillospiraceae bacterium]